MGLSREHQEALDEWFDMVVVDVPCIYPLEQIVVWSAVLNDNNFEKLLHSPQSTPALLAAVKQLRKVLEHPCPQNRRHGCPGLPTINGYVEYYTKEGRRESEPAGLLSLTPYNTATEKVTREDVVAHIKWRVNAELNKLKDTQPLENQEALVHAKQCVFVLQELIRRREDRKQREVEYLHSQVDHLLASLQRHPSADGALPRAEPPPAASPTTPSGCGQPSFESARLNGTTAGAKGVSPYISQGMDCDSSPMDVDDTRPSDARRCPNPLPTKPAAAQWGSSPSGFTMNLIIRTGEATPTDSPTPALPAPSNIEPALQEGTASSMMAPTLIIRTGEATPADFPAPALPAPSSIEPALQVAAEGTASLMVPVTTSPASNAGSSPTHASSLAIEERGHEAVDEEEVLRPGQHAEELLELRKEQEKQLAKDRIRPPVVPEFVGLENPIGAHNCFLNVVLQSLWHLGDFRRLVEELPSHRCRSNCIFCAINSLFTQYRFGNYAHIPPKEVREVVGRIFSQEQRFQVDQMDDAAEMLDAILKQLHVETASSSDLNAPCQPPCISHAVFATEIIERSVRCLFCMDVGEHLNSYVTFLHYFPASLIDSGPLEPRLRSHLESELLTCNDCHEADPTIDPSLLVHKYMCNLPRVFACVLVWKEETSTREVMQRVTSGISQTLQLTQIFRVAADGSTPLLPHVLRGMICFYGRHYMAYFWNRLLQKWVFMDDSNVRPVGDWATVTQTIIDGRHMPLVLFYVRDDGQHRASSPNPPPASLPPSSQSGNPLTAPTGARAGAERRRSSGKILSPRRYF